MGKFNWTEEYSVDVSLIDEQHKHFFQIANSIIDLTENENPKKEPLMFLAGELADYAFYHLGIEESYFDKFNYKEAPYHKTEHDNYRNKIKNYLNEVRNETTNLREITKELAVFSNDWLTHHILLVDKRYTLFFREHGF
ncbi:MAG: bacteriohemerythrin [Patescibacteria group bacterium]